jgi:hypothetical protein
MRDALAGSDPGQGQETVDVVRAEAAERLEAAGT